MARIRKRDGRRVYEAASGDLLSLFANSIDHMDGGPTGLIDMLGRLEAMHGGKLSASSMPSRRASAVLLK
jgi:hypothetical protein